VLFVNCFVGILAVALYMLCLIKPEFFNIIQGQDELSYAWKISFANVLRAGSPQSSPNTLGLYMAINAIFIYLLFILEYNVPFFKRLSLQLLFCADIAILLLTFSRSAIVFVMAAYFCFSFFKISTIKRAIKQFVAIIIIVTTFYFIANILSGNRLVLWLHLNQKLEDTSIIGHRESIARAITNFTDYCFVGYEKGTVSQKAKLFTKDSIIMVENSFFILIYDMGIIQFLIFISSYFFLFKHTLLNKFQISFLLAFLININFLPMVLEIEIIMYFLCIFVLSAYLSPENLNKKALEL
jgi:hypothetical protein